MPECDCGEHVSTTYARVFGDENGEVHECWRCATLTANHNPYQGDGHKKSADPHAEYMG